MTSVYAHQHDFNFFPGELGEPEIKHVSEITEIHKKHDIIMYDDFSPYIKPPKNMIPLLKYLRLNPLKFIATVCADEYYCTKTGKNLITYRLKGKERNPYQMKKNAGSSISRLMKQIGKLRVLKNCYKVNPWPREQRGADYLQCLDITFPEEYREQYRGDPEKFENFMARCAKEVRNFLEEYFHGKLFFWYNIHVWKTQEPTQCHPHLHINFLNVARTDDGWNWFKPFILRRVIKRIWYEVLHRVCFYEKKVRYFHKRKGAVYKDLNFKIHYIPLKNKATVRHRFKYCSRSPVKDFFDYYAEHEFEKEAIDRSFVRYVLKDFKNRRVALSCAWRMKRFTGEVDDSYECPCDDGTLVHVSTLSMNDLRVRAAQFDYFIMYLRERKIAVYPIKGGGIS